MVRTIDMRAGAMGLLDDGKRKIENNEDPDTVLEWVIMRIKRLRKDKAAEIKYRQGRRS